MLVHCAEFIEKRGMIDGIYRLSGVASNIQKLRVAFDEDRVPNLYDDRAVLQVTLGGNLQGDHPCGRLKQRIDLPMGNSGS